MKYVTIAILAGLALGLSACNRADRVGTARSGTYDFDEICVQNVKYLITTSGYGGYMTVKFNAKTKQIETCNVR